MKNIVKLLKAALVTYAETMEATAKAMQMQVPVISQTLGEMKKEFIDAAMELNLFSDFERSAHAHELFEQSMKELKLQCRKALGIEKKPKKNGKHDVHDESDETSEAQA
jgi:hypothetical protein